MATYNTMRATISYISISLSWTASGSVQAALHIDILPTVPYINAYDR